MNDTLDKLFAKHGTEEMFGPVPAAPLYSDESLALSFTQQHGDELRYVAAWNRWLRWDDARWVEENTLLAYDLARSICRDAAEGVNKAGVAKNLTASKTVAGVVALARVDRRHAATTDQWDVDPWVLNTPGGLIDLKTGRLLAHRRDAYCSKIAAASPDGDCPLYRIFADNGDLIAFVQRLAGYALTGITSEHALFFGHGRGANGKSVLVTTLAGLIGDYARTASIETFVSSPLEKHPTDLAALRGARLVTATETEEGKSWSESRLKTLTGGDKIAARFMRQDFFEYVPQFKLLVTGNTSRACARPMRRSGGA